MRDKKIWIDFSEFGGQLRRGHDEEKGIVLRTEASYRLCVVVVVVVIHMFSSGTLLMFPYFIIHLC